LVEADLPIDWQADAFARTDATVREAGKVQLEITPMTDERVLVRGRLQARFVVPCGRCLDDAHVDAGGEIVATFVPAAKHAALLAAAIERARDTAEDADLDDLDDISPEELPYDVPMLDLEGLVREELVVAYPMRALCERGEACRGLCSNCGAELNPYPHTVRRCPKCGNAVPATPAVDLEEISERGGLPHLTPLPPDGADLEAADDREPASSATDDPAEPAWKKALRSSLGPQLRAVSPIDDAAPRSGEAARGEAPRGGTRGEDDGEPG
jgi:uncharacterized metal-binding protein YceD (DUF177 family)